MGESIIRRIDISLEQVFRNIQDEVVRDMKKKYNLSEIIIPTTLASQILAAKHNGKKVLEFKIRKISLNKGFLELI
jgi:hypothetical protein